MSQAYKAYNTCPECGKVFSVKTCCGNPYRYCPDCRARKIDDFQKLVNDYLKGENK